MLLIINVINLVKLTFNKNKIKMLIDVSGCQFLGF